MSTNLMPRTPLTQEAVAEAALRIVDLYGVKALNMRALGEALDVSAPAIYHHFKDKDEVLRAITDHLRSKMRIEAPAGDDFVEWLIRLGSEYFNVFVAHPNVAPLLLSDSARSHVRTSPPLWEYILGQFAAHDVPPGDRIATLDIIESYCLGAVLVAIRNQTVERAIDPLTQLAAAERANKRTAAQTFEQGYRALIQSLVQP
jgi:TetR/AcrR family transcriptional regulator, tetracycline repressor protein